MTKSERKAWLDTAKRTGVEVKRGESLDSIKEKVAAHDRAQFRAVVGTDPKRVFGKDGER